MIRKMLFCAGRVHANGTTRARAVFLTSHVLYQTSSLSDFACSVSNNVYQIKFAATSHLVGANYIIQLIGQGVVAVVSSSVAPTAIGFQVVLYSTSSAWPATASQSFHFTVLH